MNTFGTDFKDKIIKWVMYDNKIEELNRKMI